MNAPFVRSEQPEHEEKWGAHYSRKLKENSEFLSFVYCVRNTSEEISIDDQARI